MNRLILLTTCTLLTLTGCGSTPKSDETATQPPARPEPVRLEAKLEARTQSRLTGSVVFEPAGPDSLLVKYEVTGLAKNSKHGMHIHEKGDCSAPDAASAGGHWNPDNQPHGDLTSAKRHPGDLGNIVANKKGIAKGEIRVPAFKMGSALGLSIIVHAKADDGKSQPSGEAGERIGCGVIQ